MTKKRPLKKIILWTAVGLSIMIIGGIGLIYLNLNKLLTNALNNGFNSNIISDVYELKFENLNVNIIAGNVGVHNVVMLPREKPLQDYPYINSSFRLDARKMILKNVDLFKLLRSNKLSLKKIELVEPGIKFKIADVDPVFFPFKDSVEVQTVKSDKKSIESYMLEEFKMVDAYFLVDNSAKEREFNIERI